MLHFRRFLAAVLPKTGENRCTIAPISAPIDLRQHDAYLRLVFALFVAIALLTERIVFEEQYLADALTAFGMTRPAAANPSCRTLRLRSG
jgi:hypothetical protein